MQQVELPFSKDFRKEINIEPQVVSDNMSIISHHAVIRYIGLKGLTNKELHEDMVVTLGQNVPSCSTVKQWAAVFTHSRESLEETHTHTHTHTQHRRPVTITIQETIAKIHDIIMAERQVLHCHNIPRLDLKGHHKRSVALACYDGKNLMTLQIIKLTVKDL